MRIKKLWLRIAAILGVSLMAAGAKPDAAVAQAREHLRITLRTGDVVIRMRSDLAPNHVARIIELAEQGFYDGIVFHRVIEGFMAQTGDPTGTGSGGSGQNIRAEFSSEPFRRGTVGMARSSHPDSADSQFFICFTDSEFLNNQYTVVGEVVSGMEHVDQIKRGDSAQNGAVTDPDKMLSVRPIEWGG